MGLHEAQGKVTKINSDWSPIFTAKLVHKSGLLFISGAEVYDDYS
jgi:hypothetical protein